MSIPNHAIMKKQSNGLFGVITYRDGIPFTHKDFGKREAMDYVKGFNLHWGYDTKNKENNNGWGWLEY